MQPPFDHRGTGARSWPCTPRSLPGIGRGIPPSQPSPALVGKDFFHGLDVRSVGRLDPLRPRLTGGDNPRLRSIGRSIVASASTDTSTSSVCSLASFPSSDRAESPSSGTPSAQTRSLADMGVISRGRRRQRRMRQHPTNSRREWYRWMWMHPFANGLRCVCYGCAISCAIASPSVCRTFAPAFDLASVFSRPLKFATVASA